MFRAFRWRYHGHPAAVPAEVEAPSVPLGVAARAAAEAEGGGALQKLQLSGVEDHRGGKPSSRTPRASLPRCRDLRALAGVHVLSYGWMGDLETRERSRGTVWGNGNFGAPMDGDASPREIFYWIMDLQNSKLRKNIQKLQLSGVDRPSLK